MTPCSPPNTYTFADTSAYMYAYTYTDTYTYTYTRAFYLTLALKLGKQHVYEWPQSCTTKTLIDINTNSGCRVLSRYSEEPNSLIRGGAKMSTIHQHNSSSQNVVGDKDDDRLCWRLYRRTRNILVHVPRDSSTPPQVRHPTLQAI